MLWQLKSLFELLSLATRSKQYNELQFRTRSIVPSIFLSSFFLPVSLPTFSLREIFKLFNLTAKAIPGLGKSLTLTVYQFKAESLRKMIA